MIEQKKLKDLVKLMKDNDLTELDLQDEKERVSLKRAVVGAAVPMAPHDARPPAPAPPAPVTASEPPKVVAEDAGLIAISSPMVGTFYAAAGPDAQPFIAVGDSIDADSVVCIIEAMKVFNEIKAQTAGTVQKILVESGQAVEFGQKLFLIKPH